MTKFGPNKTNKQFYIQAIIITLLIIILSLVSTAILLSAKPELKDAITTFFKKSNFISSMSRSDSDREDALEFNSHANRIETRENEEEDSSKESFLDDSLPFDLFPDLTTAQPSTSESGSVEMPLNEDVEKDNRDDNETKKDDEEVNPNEVRGEVISASHVKLASVDSFQGSKIILSLPSLGKLQGISGHVFGRSVNAFLGVPFAEPPINHLRFKRTVPITPWKGVLDVTNFKPHCPQVFQLETIEKRTPLTHHLAEDCLYLNIWSPVDDDAKDYPPEGPPKSLKPVMLWFFGGGYSGGSNNLDEFDGRVLAALGDVVVITANYRVGPFGFLDMGVNDSPGNQGLYDNKEALLWTRENIKAFGGDPEQITIFGQSAGAITTGLFMVNNHTSRLFKRAILESGSPVMLNFFFSRVEETAERFVEAMNCTVAEETIEETEDLDAVESITEPMMSDEPTEAQRRDFEAFMRKKSSELSCLNTKTTQDILDGQQQLMSTAFPFTPSPFEDFLPMMATDALKAEKGTQAFFDSFNNIQDVLIGSNSDEGSVILHLEIPEVFEADKINLNITTLAQLKDLLVTNFSKEFNIDSTTANLFANIFFSSGPDEDTTMNLVKRLHEVIGGLAFTCPVVMFAEGLTARGVNVYEYEFGYRSSASPWGSWMGVTHGDEYIFTFGHPLRYPNKYSAEDAEVSKRMIETWSHFARTGRVPKQNSKKWPKFTRERGDFMKINLKHSRVSYKIQDRVCSLFSVGLESFKRRRRDIVSSRLIQVIESFAKYSAL